MLNPRKKHKHLTIGYFYGLSKLYPPQYWHYTWTRLTQNRPTTSPPKKKHKCNENMYTKVYEYRTKDLKKKENNVLGI